MDRPPESPSFSLLLRAFWGIGLLSFGGPAGQIALMHRELVEERGWVSEDDYLHALNFCHFLPGPEAQQLATWIGWRLHGWRGGLAAGLLFVIPGAVIILALSILYAVAAVNRRSIGTPYRRAKGTPLVLHRLIDVGRWFRAAGGVGRA